MKSLEDRFWGKVNKLSINECWVWTGCKEKMGHGRIRVNKSTREMAHRLSYILANGEIPKDKCVCHSCDNPSCVNPNHLWVGSKGQNNTDRASKGRSAKAIGELNNSSKLTNENVIEIKNLIKGGVKPKQLAIKFNVSQATIGRIKNNLGWNQV